VVKESWGRFGGAAANYNALLLSRRWGQSIVDQSRRVVASTERGFPARCIAELVAGIWNLLLAHPLEVALGRTALSTMAPS